MRNIAVMGFPISVKWYITSRCNLRCRHCYLTDYTESGDLERILPIIDYLGRRQVHSIALLGGEPLVRDDLEIIVGRLQANNIHIKIATNALLASGDRAASLVAAGARRFQVSIEEHTAQLNDPVRGPRTFNRILDGIAALRRAGAAVVIALTVTRKNYREIGELFKFADEQGVSGVRLNAFVPVGTGAIAAQDYQLTHEIARQVSDELMLLQSRFSRLRVEAGAFVAKVAMPGAAPIPSGRTFGCGAGTNMLIINSDFTVSACDLLNEEDRTVRQIQQPEDIGEIWKEDLLFRKWRGQTRASHLASIPDFSGVHAHGCQAAYAAYRGNIFQ